jgi:VanZ family protein
MRILLTALIMIPIMATAQIRTDHKLHFLVGSTVASTVMHLPAIQKKTDFEKVLYGTVSATVVGLAGEFVDSYSSTATMEASDIFYTYMGGLITSTINVYVIQKIGRKKRKKR